ncbi:MAG: two-component system sensor histidine kinase CreC [Zoogloeaceae bacterium]|jgi:two-component system sensor histidine kinase CreC|nr:two-component system sensor histidine kinase CreC [Zoogloeaceae bacterium]
MNISVRLFLGYFLVVGLAAWFVLDIVTQEVEPGLRQATEETLVDAAHMLAELAAHDLAAKRIDSGDFADALQAARRRLPAADIFGVKKESVDFRVYVSDARGIVVFDSENKMLGSDFSRWKDVSSVLRGEYGARTTRENPELPNTSSLYVSAPIFWRGELIGVLSLAKPAITLQPYIQRAISRLRRDGFAMLAISAIIGLIFSFWLMRSIYGFVHYAQAVSVGEKAEAPTGGGRQFSELARALAAMRERLEGKQYVEKYVQNLTHEMKSPLTAIVSAAELMETPLPDAERQRFARLVRDEAKRLQQGIERMLQLARVEQLQRPEDDQTLDLGELTRQCVENCRVALADRTLRLQINAVGGFPCRGDAFLLQQAIDNLLDNAIAFSPAGGLIRIDLEKQSNRLRLCVRDQGRGAPDYALPQLFERFYSLPRPATGRKSTGLGLPFVREVAQLHGGNAQFVNHPEGGAEVSFEVLAA